MKAEPYHAFRHQNLCKDLLNVTDNFKIVADKNKIVADKNKIVADKK